MEPSLKNFSGLYPLAKTLTFQLKPIGKTNEFIQNRGLISTDEMRAEKYKIVKTIIDRRHKKFIDDVLSSFSFEAETLKCYSELYDKKDKSPDEIKSFNTIRNAMRKGVSKKFKEHPDYKKLKGKPLIKSELDEILQNEEEKRLIREFDQWSTYFTGFSENRENMYAADEKATAIGFRIVEQNLPKFLDNLKVYQKCIETVPEIFNEVNPLLLERNGSGSLEKIFQLDAFSRLLTQKSIERFNELIGGYSGNDGAKQKGLNEYVNLYNQKNASHLPSFVPLFKQILSDRVQELSCLPEAIESDEELLKEIFDLWKSLQGFFEEKIPNFLKQLPDFDPNGIFIANDAVLTTIIQRLYGAWDKFKIAWTDRYLLSHPKRTLDKAAEEYRKIKSFSVAEIRECIGTIKSEEALPDILQYFLTPMIPNGSGKETPLLLRVNSAYCAVQDLLFAPPAENRGLIHNKKAIALLKNFLDSLKDTQRFVKMLSGTGKEPGKDMDFYAKLEEIIAAFEPVTMVYNRVRNYLCQKPYSLEKFKLNFDCVTFLNGWDENKEKSNRGVLLKKDGAYFLGIFAKGKYFDFANAPTENPCYEKLICKQTGNPANLLFNLMVIDGKTVKINGHKESEDTDPEKKNPALERAKNQYLPPNINRIRKSHSYMNGENFSKEDLCAFIEYYQQRIIEYKAPMIFSFKPVAEYLSFDEFCDDVKNTGYSLSFRNVSVAYIDQLVEQGDLYLFQIWNKDFSAFSKGTPNMHTLYWRALFDPRNLADVIFKLSGKAEVFYRKASIPADQQIIHPANQAIPLRRNANEKRSFPYDLVKNRRFTYDQFSFHVPLTINFKVPKAKKIDINAKVREWLCSTESPHVIGIDRGERNLIYVSVIDAAGKIQYQKSLNEIVSCSKSGEFTTDYHHLLDKREKEKDEAQKSWQSIENIKELKAGYLSQVIHELTQLIFRYNAVICLEDLNSGFMRGRQKVDKSVYQQFERDLIKKLQYVADKKIPIDQTLGILHGSQLVKSDISCKGSQNGIIFYIPAWCTSKIDPVTGFVDLFGSRYLRWENIAKTKKFFADFKAIRYNQKEDFFEFTFDYANFTDKAQGTQTVWTVCSFGERLRSFRNPAQQNHWDTQTVNLTSEFKTLFEKYGIGLASDLHAQIVSQAEKKDFWYNLLELFKLTIQLRNSKSNSTAAADDYILSPIRDKNGNFFDSRRGNSSLPMDADANGAYNIARKGLWVVKKIRGSADPLKEKIAMTQKDWLKFVQAN